MKGLACAAWLLVKNGDCKVRYNDFSLKHLCVCVFFCLVCCNLCLVGAGHLLRKKIVASNGTLHLAVTGHFFPTSLRRKIFYVCHCLVLARGLGKNGAVVNVKPFIRYLFLSRKNDSHCSAGNDQQKERTEILCCLFLFAPLHSSVLSGGAAGLFIKHQLVISHIQPRVVVVWLIHA